MDFGLAWNGEVRISDVVATAAIVAVAGMRRMPWRRQAQQWRFDARDFPMSADEPAIDHLLFVYDLIGYYAETGVIEEGELPIIRFEASRVLHNKEMVKYLTWLDDEYAGAGVTGPAYAHARKLAERVTRP